MVVLWVVWVPWVLWAWNAAAQDKKPEKKDLPRVTVVLPLGAPVGATTRLTIRGLKLDSASQVRFQDPKIAVKLLNKGKAPVPDKQEPARLGDTQVEVEANIPPGTPTGPAAFVVVTPAGETLPHPLLVEGTVPLVAEKEPNNSFRQAHSIQVPQVIHGIIQHPQDVDVFRFEGQAGAPLVFEVQAARLGSLLDALLTLYDADGRQLAVNDDSEGSTDSRLEIALPYTGTYYLSLMDALDLGGPVHVYRLSVQASK